MCSSFNEAVPNASFFPSAVTHPLCIIDSGYLLAHPDLPSDATAADPLQADRAGTRYFGGDICNHGTHVAGILAGDNLSNPIVHDAADGNAPAAKLVIQDGGFGADDCGDLPGIGCPARSRPRSARSTP